MSGGFDYANYQKSQGISAKIQASKSDLKEMNTSRNSWINAIKETREETAVFLKQYLGEEESALAEALLIGKKENLEKETKEIFQDSSLSHMIAISGAHVGIVLGVLNWISNRTLKRFGKILMIFFLLFFSVFTGASSSVIRACICSGLTILASLLFRKSDAYNNLAISLIYLILQNPFCIFDLGLELSYLGTIGVLINLQKKNVQKDEKKILTFWNQIKEAFKLTLKVNLLLLPILIISFHKLSFAFLFTGIILNPLVTCILVLGFFLVFIFKIQMKLAIFLMPVLNKLLGIFQSIAEIFAEIPGITIYMITPGVEWIFIYYCVLIFYRFKPKEKKKKRWLEISISVFKKWICVLLILNILITIYINLNQNFEIHFLDQTTTNMIQRISHLFAINPLISKEI